MNRHSIILLIQKQYRRMHHNSNMLFKIQYLTYRRQRYIMKWRLLRNTQYSQLISIQFYTMLGVQSLKQQLNLQIINRLRTFPIPSINLLNYTICYHKQYKSTTDKSLYITCIAPNIEQDYSYNNTISKKFTKLKQFSIIVTSIHLPPLDLTQL